VKGKYYINIYDQETHKRRYFEVSYDVYMYIMQLEGKIKWPKKSCLFDAYPELECES